MEAEKNLEIVWTWVFIVIFFVGLWHTLLWVISGLRMVVAGILFVFLWLTKDLIIGSINDSWVMVTTLFAVQKQVHMAQPIDSSQQVAEKNLVDKSQAGSDITAGSSTDNNDAGTQATFGLAKLDAKHTLRVSRFILFINILALCIAPMVVYQLPKDVCFCPNTSRIVDVTSLPPFYFWLPAIGNLVYLACLR